MKYVRKATKFAALGLVVAGLVLLALRPVRGDPPKEAANLEGTWDSDWGPVTLILGEATPEDAKWIPFVGYWKQDTGKRGLIKEGTFGRQTRKMVFSYYQDWNKQDGRAELTLAADGKKLSGTWKQQDGEGTWEMTRNK